MALTDNVSRDDLRRIMKEHGPQWSKMYFRPLTPQQHQETAAEYKAGIKRVRDYLKSNKQSFPEVKPGGSNSSGRVD